MFMAVRRKFANFPQQFATFALFFFYAEKVHIRVQRTRIS
jgi:hypothetical protein